MRITPLVELQNRLKKFQKLLIGDKIDAVCIVQNSDLFYFTGSIQRGVLFVPSTGEPVYMVIKDHGRARMESGLAHVVDINSLRDIEGVLTQLGYSQPELLGLELDVLPVQIMNSYQRLFPQSKITNVGHLIRTVRACKSSYEIEIMKDCAYIANQTYEYAKTILAEGKTDIDIAAELECFMRKQGHQGITRFRRFNSELNNPHVFSGADGAVPTYLDAPLGGLGLNPAVAQGAGFKKIVAGEPIIIDFIIAFDGYLVDQTRTLSIGPVAEPLKKAYYDMLAIQEHLCEIAKPGVSWGTIYDSCMTLAASQGHTNHFMGGKGAQVGFIGHGIGIEIDEYPFIAQGFYDDVLQEGMTFAFEPKAVFPGLGTVGVENTWRVAADGIKRLTYAGEDLWQVKA